MLFDVSRFSSRLRWDEESPSRREILESLHTQQPSGVQRQEVSMNVKENHAWITPTAGHVALLTTLLASGCGLDYWLNGMDSLPAEMQLSEFQDCTSIVGDRYWYQDHTFGVVMIYDGCDPVEYNAYLLIEHQFELMDQAWTTASYTTENGDEITADAVRYTLDFWYNPVDIEVTVIPFQGYTALGIHEFWIDCTDDDDGTCPVVLERSVTIEDLE